MTPAGKPLRNFRVDHDLWDRFGAAVPDGDRSGMLRVLMRWYLREKGARLPDRPPLATLEAMLDAHSGQTPERAARARKIAGVDREGHMPDAQS